MKERGRRGEDDGSHLRLFLLLLQRYTFLPGCEHFVEGIHADRRPERITKKESGKCVSTVVACAAEAAVSTGGGWTTEAETVGPFVSTYIPQL